MAHQLRQGLQQKRTGSFLRYDEVAAVVPHVLGGSLGGSVARNGLTQLSLVLAFVGMHDAPQQQLVLHGQRGKTGEVEALGKVGIGARQRIGESQVERHVAVNLLDDDCRHGLYGLLAAHQYVVFKVEVYIVDV